MFCPQSYGASGVRVGPGQTGDVKSASGSNKRAELVSSSGSGQTGKVSDAHCPLLAFQFKEFLGTYNKVTELCFMDCVKDFTSRDVGAEEVKRSCSPGVMSLPLSAV